MKLMDFTVNRRSFIKALYFNLSPSLLLISFFFISIWFEAKVPRGLRVRVGRGAFGFMPGCLCICVFIDVWEYKGRLLSTHIPPLPRDK